VPKYVICAQTFKDPRVREVNGEPVTRVEYHLVDVAPAIVGGRRSICGEIVDPRSKPQSVQRWQVLMGSVCKKCERLAGTAAREQAKNELAAPDRSRGDYQD
jgi:hypothetical protein